MQANLRTPYARDPDTDRYIWLSEQGLRDGLQSVTDILSTSEKLNIIGKLQDAGLKRIQVCSFVHPRRVPQMADAELLCAQLPRTSDVEYSGLTLNRKGVERALDAGLEWIVISHSASDTHSRKNTGRSRDEAAQEIRDLVRWARQQGVKVRAGVQCAFGCRYEGLIDHGLVLGDLQHLLDAGANEVALADSTGMGHPGTIKELVGTCLDYAQDKPLWLHLHDTEGKGMVNALAALEVGARHFDVALGGLGGCPFIKSASGNLATEDFTHLVHQLGWVTEVNPQQVSQTANQLAVRHNWTLQSKMSALFEHSDLKILGIE